MNLTSHPLTSFQRTARFSRCDMQMGRRTRKEKDEGLPVIVRACVREHESDLEKGKEREREREKKEGDERAGRVVASAGFQRKGLKTSPLLSQPSSILTPVRTSGPTFTISPSGEIISRYHL